MTAMKLEVNEAIITKQLLINDEKKDEELETLFPAEQVISSTIIKPVPGFCVKTKNTKTLQKAFVNVCTSDTVPAPEDISNDELLQILASDEPSDFRIPMSIGQPHEETDKSGKNACYSYDVVVNRNFFEKLKDNPLFENFFMIVTIESLEDKYDVSLDKNSWTILKNKKYHGSLPEQRVRTTLPLVQELSGIKKWTPEDFPAEAKPKETGSERVTEPLIKEIKTTVLDTDFKKKKPKFNIISSGSHELFFKAEVSLPGVMSADKIDVKIGEDRVVVETEEYFLDQVLASSLNATLSKAYFIKNIRVLVLSLSQNRQ